MIMYLGTEFWYAKLTENKREMETFTITFVEINTHHPIIELVDRLQTRIEQNYQPTGSKWCLLSEHFTQQENAHSF